VVLTARVAFPRCPRRFKSVHYDICVLGSQPLHALADVICCPMNEQPVNNAIMRPLKDFPSTSSFFIEGTFYSDHRQVSQDLAMTLKDWASENKEVLNFSKDAPEKDMSECTFDDISIVLGRTYVFLHHGNCEHEISFVDLRLHSLVECRSKKEYPITVTKPRIKVIPCKVCHIQPSTWVTRNDVLSDEDPSFFCTRCYFNLHFDIYGRKVADFEARPYVQLISLPYPPPAPPLALNTGKSTKNKKKKSKTAQNVC